MEQKELVRKEYRKEYARQYREKHREKINEQKRQYFKNNEDKRKAHYKRVAEYIRKRCEEDSEYRERRNAYYREKTQRKKDEKELVWARNIE